MAKFPATIQKIRFQAAQVDKEMQGAVRRLDALAEVMAEVRSCWRKLGPGKGAWLKHLGGLG